MKEKEIFIESMFDDSFDRFSHTFSVVAVHLCEGESMGNVPPYTRLVAAPQVSGGGLSSPKILLSPPRNFLS